MVVYLILGAITVIAVAVLVLSWRRLDRQFLRRSPYENAQELAALEEEVRQLRDRVETLEAIEAADS